MRRLRRKKFRLISVLAIDTTLSISANIWAVNSRKVDKSFASQVASLTPKLTFAKNNYDEGGDARNEGKKEKDVKNWKTINFAGIQEQI